MNRKEEAKERKEAWKRKEDANEVILYIMEFLGSFQFKYRIVRGSFKIITENLRKEKWL